MQKEKIGIHQNLHFFCSKVYVKNDNFERKNISKSTFLSMKKN